MKKEVKNNGHDNKNISYRKIDFSTKKRKNNLPSLEIVMKKEIKAYENLNPNYINSRNGLKTQINNFRTYTNNSNLISTSKARNKNLSIYTFNTICSPVKKNSNTSQFRRKNALINLTESKTYDKVRLIKSNNSQSPESFNLLDIKVNNTLLNKNYEKTINGKSALLNRLLNINCKNKNINLKDIKNYKKNIRCSRKVNEKNIKDYLNKKMYKNNNPNSDNHIDNIKIYPNSITNNNKINNNINFNHSTKNKILFSISRNSNDNLSYKKFNSRKNYESLFLSNSETINNKFFNIDSSINNELNFNTDYINEENRIKSAKKMLNREDNHILSRNIIRKKKNN